MTAQTKTIVKGYFNTGDVPTEANFTALIDSYGAPTYYVAASNALAHSKGLADYVCDGTDDQTDIQAAIDALGTTGGRVQLSEGTFNLASGGQRVVDPIGYFLLQIPQTLGDVELIGSGWGTILRTVDAQPARCPTIMVHGLSASKRTSRTRIAHLQIDGNEAGQVDAWSDFALIQHIYADSVTTDDVYLHDAKKYPWHVLCNSLYCKLLNSTIVGNSVDAPSFVEAPYAEVSRNKFFASTTGGVGGCLSFVANADIGVISEKGRCTDNWFIGGYQQLGLEGTKQCIISENHFVNSLNNNGVSLKLGFFNSIIADYDAIENSVTGNVFANIRQAILVTGDAVNGSMRNRITNNLISEGGDTSLVYGILQSGAASSENIIENNTILGATNPVAILAGTATVKNNIGWITENGGASSVADGGTVSHGLATTPTHVIVTPSVADEFAQVTALGATTFTVALTKHDGSAGTTQTVYWRAYV